MLVTAFGNISNNAAQWDLDREIPTGKVKINFTGGWRALRSGQTKNKHENVGARRRRAATGGAAARLAQSLAAFRRSVDAGEVVHLGVGQEQGGDVLVHEARGFGELEIGHHVGHPAFLLQQFPGEGQ